LISVHNLFSLGAPDVRIQYQFGALFFLSASDNIFLLSTAVSSRVFRSAGRLERLESSPL
jgi:hypothetical protein